ncbi:leucyl aminopeptidase [Bacillus horti]|uniref:Probable cytosol aminopeptidase n=1 Tax=Caldalkalibacillus horti TaxID=77523 RepID=A0ABT9VU75_9BACI|nr:leucyl aminopeptidase [Bacillus horti]MDQ0164387.1 leucyl aminopeptidase [Bacillus horti]
MNINVYQKQSTDGKQAELLFIGYYENSEPKGECFKELDAHLEGQLSSLLKEDAGIGKKKTVTVVPLFNKAPHKKVVFVGLGKVEKATIKGLNQAIGAAVKQADKLGLATAAVCLESFTHDTYTSNEVAHALTESIVLASHTFENYKTDKKDTKGLEEVSILVCSEDVEEVEAGVQTGLAFAKGTCLARDLVNTPGNLMTPTKLAEQAVNIAETYGMEYSILEREEMEKLGMGALLAVAQGSAQPPKMIVLKYQGKETWDDVLAFVGKGLTFDTGGISLKPAASMHEMKMDMGGSAAVLGAMEVIGQLKPECNILAVIPSSENMPGSKALKPGDVITSLSGKTIEVRNTDAEGRLILADGITYAKQLGANYIVDLATLTGAIIIALGHTTTGAVTNDEDFMIDVLESSHEAGELVWRLPNFDEYLELVKSSDVADLNNAPGRPAGSITAGLFLGEFAEDTPWVHLDIAGTAWTGKSSELSQQGGTGVMVRTLSVLADRHAEKK